MVTREQSIEKWAKYCAAELGYPYWNGLDASIDKKRSIEQQKESVRTWYSVLDGFDPYLTNRQRERVMSRFFRDMFSVAWYERAGKRVSHPSEASLRLKVSSTQSQVDLDSTVEEYQKESRNLMEEHLLELVKKVKK